MMQNYSKEKMRRKFNGYLALESLNKKELFEFASKQFIIRKIVIISKIFISSEKSPKDKPSLKKQKCKIKNTIFLWKSKIT